jgi:hypothetical protein
VSYLKDLKVFGGVLLADLIDKTKFQVFTTVRAQLHTIISVNSIIYSELEDAAVSDWSSKTVGGIFNRMAPTLKCYKDYVAGYAEASALIKDVRCAFGCCARRLLS